MDYRDLLKPRNVDKAGAVLIIGRELLFLRMLQAKWLFPVVDKYNIKLYAVDHINACCDLLEAGYLPTENDPNKATLEAAMAGAMRSAYARA